MTESVEDKFGNYLANYGYDGKSSSQKLSAFLRSSSPENDEFIVDE